MEREDRRSVEERHRATIFILLEANPERSNPLMVEDTNIPRARLASRSPSGEDAVIQVLLNTFAASAARLGTPKDRARSVRQSFSARCAKQLANTPG